MAEFLWTTLEQLKQEAGSNFIRVARDTPTRWNSTVDMVGKFLRMKPAVEVMMLKASRGSTTGRASTSEEPERVTTLETTDWLLMEQLEGVLGPFKEASTHAEADTYPTINTVVPLYNELLDRVDRICHQRDKGIFGDMLSAAKSNLERYYDRTSEICTVATVLDPTLKFQYHAGSSGAGHIPVTAVEAQVRKVYNDYADKFPNLRKQVRTSSSHPTAPPTSPSMIDNIFQRVVAGVTSLPDDEVKTYMSTPTAPRGTEILTWWSDHEKEYPVLAAMARDFLAIPATSAASERAFSLARHLLTPFRQCIEDENVQQCMRLKYWMRQLGMILPDDWTSKNDV